MRDLREIFASVAGGAVAAAVLLSANGAVAMEKFPGKLVEYSKKIEAQIQSADGGAVGCGASGPSEMPCAPQCTICHQTSQGGLKTVTRPFGKTMFGYGLDPAKPDSVEGALIQDVANGDDSDGDGVCDFDELLAGTNPSIKGDAPLCGPESGCFARIAPHPTDDTDNIAGFAGIAAALSLIAVARKRRRR
jgi:hypothetical protein